MPVDSDSIGISYKIDLIKLSNSIKAAEKMLGNFNRKIEELGRQTSTKMNTASASINNVSSASSSASAQLKLMGISANTTAAEIKAMNLSAVETSAALKLTRQRMKELTDQTAKAGGTTKASREEFKRLQSRMPMLEHEANKGVKAFGDYRRAMDRWGQGFKFMMLSQAAWIASGAVLFGTLSAIGNAIKNFVDFHQDLRNAAAIVQATTTGYEKMEKAAVKAFLNSTLSLKEATNALTILGQTGMEAADAAIALETVYKITTATGGDMTTVVKFLTTAINVWKLEATDAAKVGNVLGAALNYSKLEVEDLGTTFNYVASLAKSVGMSITDLSATMAVMSNAGIKASTIGTGLRGVFSKLLSPSRKFEKELEKVGLTMDDVNLRTKGFFTVLKNLEAAGFDIGNIFKGMRRREAAAMNVLLEQGTERLGLMREALTDTDAVSVMFERSMKGMKNQIILAGHAMQQYMIDRFNILRPIITGVAITVRELFVSLSELNTTLLWVGGALIIYKVKTLAAATSTTVFATALKALQAAFIFMKSHWILTSLTLLVAGYTAVRMAVNSFTDSLDKQRMKSAETIDAMRKLQVMVQDTNKTERERLKIFKEFAKDYPQLLDFFDDHKTRMEGIQEAAQGVIDVEQDLTRIVKLRSLAQAKADLVMQESRMAARERQREENKEGGLVGKFFDWAIINPQFKRAEEKAKELRNTIRLLESDLGIKTGPGIEYGDTGGIEAGVGTKWTKKLQEELEKLRFNAASKREQAKIEYDKDLTAFESNEYTKFEVETNMLEARHLLLKKYQKKLDKINEEEQAAKKIIFDKLRAGIKKEDDIISKFDTKQRVRKEKEITRREKELEKATDSERKWISNIAKLNEGLTEDNINLIDDEHTKKQFYLEKEITERRRKYKELLEAAEDYFIELAKLAEDNPLLIPELDKNARLIEDLKRAGERLPGIEEGKRGALADEAPENYASGMKKGFGEALDEINNQFEIWKRVAENTALSMRDTFSDIFFDGMKGELKSLGDYWTAFSTAVKRQIADMASAWVMSGLFGKRGGSGGLLGDVIGGIGNLFGGGSTVSAATAAATTFHGGGLNRQPGDTLNVLREKEFVMKDSSTRSIGLDALNFMNKTGRVPSGGSTTNINNSYTIVAMDSESMDQALRRGGAKAIQDISVGSIAFERERQNPVFRR